MSKLPDRVVIGMDPHKRSVTVEVMAADDAVDGSPRRPSADPGRAASASTGGFRHRTSGVGTGAIVIASTSTSVRVWSASIFKNTSPTRRVARS